MDALVAGYPAAGVAEGAASVARAESRARLEKLNVKLSDNVATALEGVSQ
jgi:hypothetical protein